MPGQVIARYNTADKQLDEALIHNNPYNTPPVHRMSARPPGDFIEQLYL